ncbi:MAG: ribonuclease PH [Alphaproteobacteria bacterium]
MRLSGRLTDEIREIKIETDICAQAEGSCLIKFGNTHVICTATIDDNIPPFLKGKNKGWVTAEYGMLPRSTHQRMKREAAQGKQSGRTQEIQRLIGRSLRAVTDLNMLREKQLIIDCDVIQADGGTRTASITGGYVAMYLAFSKLVKKGVFSKLPLISEVAAISCGICNGVAVVDLDYEEDSTADVDANFVMTSSGSIIEIQASAERSPFNEDELGKMMQLAKVGIEQLIDIQRTALKINFF